MDHAETYGANIFFLFCNTSLQVLAARKKNLVARKILLCHNIKNFFGARDHTATALC